MTNQQTTGTPRSPSDEAAGTQKAKAVAEQAGDRAKDVAAQVKDQTREVASEAKDHARDVFDQARGEIRQQADVGTKRAAEGMRNLSQQLRALHEGRPSEAGPVAQYVSRANQKVEELASRLDRDGLDGVMADVSRFARRRPGMFLLASAGAGFAIARMVRSQRAASSPSASLPPPSPYEYGYGYETRSTLPGDTGLSAAIEP